ncbi:MAG TPA: hypothetical protein DCY74_06990 [Clostridiales bacterium]|jgi:hypothetical protein|nr:hypothetical protein [Clostridiales bacterium]
MIGWLQNGEYMTYANDQSICVADEWVSLVRQCKTFVWILAPLQQWGGLSFSHHGAADCLPQKTDGRQANGEVKGGFSISILWSIESEKSLNLNFCV